MAADNFRKLIDMGHPYADLILNFWHVKCPNLSHLETLGLDCELDGHEGIGSCLGEKRRLGARDFANLLLDPAM